MTSLFYLVVILGFFCFIFCFVVVIVVFQVKDSLNSGRLKEKNSVSFSFDRDPAHQNGAIHNKHSHDFGTQVELTSSESCLLGL